MTEPTKPKRVFPFGAATKATAPLAAVNTVATICHHPGELVTGPEGIQYQGSQADREQRAGDRPRKPAIP